MIPPIPDDFEMVDLSEERMKELLEIDIQTRRQAFAELNGMAFRTHEHMAAEDPFLRKFDDSSEDPAM